MKKNLRNLTGVAAAVMAIALSAGAQAQTSTTTTSASGGGMSNWSGTSWYPSGSRYIGLNVGSGDVGGGACVIDCDDSTDVYSLYTGGMWNKNFGMELGATDFKEFDRGAGLSAYGFSVKAVGVLPLTPSFSAFAKAGTIYHRTRGSLDGLQSAVRDSDWGSTYGLGVSVDFTPNMAAVLEFDQSNLRFAGEREHINTTSLGLKYRF